MRTIYVTLSLIRKYTVINETESEKKQYVAIKI